MLQNCVSNTKRVVQAGSKLSSAVSEEGDPTDCGGDDGPERYDSEVTDNESTQQSRQGRPPQTEMTKPDIRGAKDNLDRNNNRRQQQKGTKPAESQRKLLRENKQLRKDNENLRKEVDDERYLRKVWHDKCMDYQQLAGAFETTDEWLSKQFKALFRRCQNWAIEWGEDGRFSDILSDTQIKGIVTLLCGQGKEPFPFVCITEEGLQHLLRAKHGVRLALESIMSHFVVALILQRPLHFLGNSLGSKRSKITTETVTQQLIRHAEAEKPGGGHLFTGQIIRAIHPPSKDVKDDKKSKRDKNSAFHEQELSWHEYISSRVLQPPCRALLKKTKNKVQRDEHSKAEFLDICKSASMLSRQIYAQDMSIISLGIDHIDFEDHFEASSSLMEAHSAMKLRSGDTSADGRKPYFVTRPCVKTRSPKGHSESDRPWLKALVLLLDKPATVDESSRADQHPAASENKGLEQQSTVSAESCEKSTPRTSSPSSEIIDLTASDDQPTAIPQVKQEMETPEPKRVNFANENAQSAKSKRKKRSAGEAVSDERIADTETKDHPDQNPHKKPKTTHETRHPDPAHVAEESIDTAQSQRKRPTCATDVADCNPNEDGEDTDEARDGRRRIPRNCGADSTESGIKQREAGNIEKVTTKKPIQDKHCLNSASPKVRTAQRDSEAHLRPPTVQSKRRRNVIPKRVDTGRKEAIAARAPTKESLAQLVQGIEEDRGPWIETLDDKKSRPVATDPWSNNKHSVVQVSGVTHTKDTTNGTRKQDGNGANVCVKVEKSEQEAAESQEEVKGDETKAGPKTDVCETSEEGSVPGGMSEEKTKLEIMQDASGMT